VELIAAALSAGAAAGLTDTAAAAVKDTYAGLKRLLRQWVRGDAREALEADETVPGLWEDQIGEDLIASGADQDEEILTLARRLLELVGQPSDGKYWVDVSNSKGVQIGDHTKQTNYF
jgi:hypothetical protein